MSRTLSARAWLLFLVAVISACAAAFFVYTVLQMQAERAAYAADAAAANLQQGQSAQLHALARETADERAKLTSFADTDLLSAVNLIESVAASGTPVRVVNAQASKAPKGGPQQMDIVDLTVQADGSFSALMRILQMMETLPLATTIKEVDIERAPLDESAKNTVAAWQMVVKLRFYTTAALSI